MVVKGHNKNSEKIIYKSMVISVLNYGAVTLILYEDGRRGINVTQMDAIRRSTRLYKLDRKANE
jgi:hypothetical protein